MLRKPRFNLIGIPQHVIQHGNNREPCFYAEQDNRRFPFSISVLLGGGAVLIRIMVA